jgi:hypothetical protein
MVGERIALFEEMYNPSVRRECGPADPASGVVADIMDLLAGD